MLATLGITTLALLASPHARAGCNLGDEPDCTCFDDDDGTWSPTPSGSATDPAGDLLEVLDQMATPTATPVRESCYSSVGRWGGKPYYMIMLGSKNANIAQITADYLYGGGLLAVRQAWCSETVAYSHLMADVPTTGGYRTAWYPHWQTHLPYHLRQWYLTSEKLDDTSAPGGPHLGFWMAPSELDLSLPAGEGYPCPGHYVKVREYHESDGEWHTIHSATIASMTVYENGPGNVQWFTLETVDGNLGKKVRYPTKVWDSRYDLADGSLGDFDLQRHIHGFGVDEHVVTGVEVPTCDSTNITTSITSLNVTPWDGIPEVPLTPWYPFALAVLQYGLNVDLDGTTYNAPRLAQESVGEIWTIDGADFSDGEAVLDIEWPMALPFDVDQVEIRFDDDTVTSVTAEALDGGGLLLADSDTLGTIDGSYTMLPLDDEVQPTTLRLIIERTENADLDILDVMLRPYGVGP